MFRDRQDAGQRLGEALSAYKTETPLVLAIPRGGVEVGYYVARKLEAPLAIVVVRKLPWPGDPEAGFGAVAEDGSLFIFEHMRTALDPAVVKEIVQKQKREIRRRIQVLRNSAPLPRIAERTVILVDDGIAMGSTVRAAITLCRNEQAGKIIVAAPVASPSAAKELTRLADSVVIVERPFSFRAVAQVYENWYDVSDEEGLAFMREFAEQKV
jgi:putative phosphoribosyl transferase